MLAIRDTTRENETIELASGDTAMIARSTFRRCTIVGSIAAPHLTVVDSTFEECEIRWRRPLRNKSWRQVRFNGCRFVGRFVGNRFGSNAEGDFGGLLESDFSAAVLDGTDFLNCDMSRIRLPAWPCFTLLEPAAHADLLREVAQDAPAALALKLKICAESPREVAAVTWCADTIADKSAAEDLRHHLRPLDALLR